VAIGLDRGRRQRRALRKLNAEFERQTGKSVEEMARPNGGGGGGSGGSTAAGEDAAALEPDIRTLSTTADVQQLPLSSGATRRQLSPAAPALASETSVLKPAPSHSQPQSSVPTAAGAASSGVRNEFGVEMHALSSSPSPDADDTLPAAPPGSVVLSVRTREKRQPVQRPVAWWRRVFCCCARNTTASSSRRSGSSRAAGASSSAVVPSKRSSSRSSRSGAGRGEWCTSMGLQLSEVRLMHKSIGSILHALSSYDQLEQINHAKRQFIRYIFHEVRVPFNAIVLGAEQLQLHAASLRGEHAQDIRDTSLLITEQATVVARILNDVLSMQKIEDGGLVLAPEAFDLAALVRVTLASFKEMLQAKHLTLLTHLPQLETASFARGVIPEGGKLLVYADRYRLRQVLSNFLSNALAYSPPFASITCKISVDESSFQPASAASSSSSSSAAAATRAARGGAAAASSSPNGPAGAMPRKNSSGSRHPNPNPNLNPVANSSKSSPATGYRTSAGGNNSGSNVNVGVNAATVSKLGVGTVGPSQRISSSEDSSSVQGSGMRAANGGAALPPPANMAHFDPLSNDSRTHTPSGGSACLFGTASFRVSVADQGPGIPVEHQGKIFSAYKQVQSARIQQGRGTGLGLQISRSIIELHGGRIGFTTQPGRGTDFHFTLPLPILLTMPPRGSPGGSGAGARASGAGGTKRGAAEEQEDDGGLMMHHPDDEDPPRSSPEEGKTTGAPTTAAAATSRHSSGRSEEVPSVHFHGPDDFDVEVAVYSDMLERDKQGDDGEGAAAAGAEDRAPLNLTSNQAVSRGTNYDEPRSGDERTALLKGGNTSSPATGAVVAASAAATRDSASSESAPRKPRVLVVEDSLPNRKLLLSLLRLLKVDPVGAEHGQACVDLFADTIERGAPVPFAMVLMDGSMPVMSGLEATTILRRAGIQIPIVAVTGNALAEDQASFLAAGASAVLVKPINRAMLVNALHTYLPPELAKQIPKLHTPSA